MKIILLIAVFLSYSCSLVEVSDHPLYFWKATKGKTEIVFFGTLHLDTEILRDEVKHQIQRSDLVFVESVDKHSEKEYKNLIGTALLVPDESLKKELTPTGLQRLNFTLHHKDFDQFAKQLNIGHGRDFYSPLLVLSFIRKNINYKNYKEYLHPETFSGLSNLAVLEKDLVESFKEMKEGVIVDDRVLGWAKEYQKTLISLDDRSSSDLALLAVLNNDALTFVKLLVGDIEMKEYNEREYKLEDLKEYYWSKNLGKMESIINHFRPSYKKLILEDRNKLWAEKLSSPQYSGKRIFASAGIGHFIGPNNILELLRQRGFIVR